METKWGGVGAAVEVLLDSFLNLALDGGEWSASRPGCFNLKERTCITN
jgi:hypothetical protein